METTAPSRTSQSYPSTTPSEPITSTVDASALRQGSFFDKERERLISEIAQGIESIMSTSNALNRKLEESITVGKEFEPIAGLWGRFSEMMNTVGIPDPYADRYGQARPSNSKSHQQDRAQDDGRQHDDDDAPQHSKLSRSATHDEKRDTLRQSAVEHTLPPGVAPGGGTIYQS